VLVTNDSGPAHVGYALGTPTVTVFGSTEPARWGPRSGEQYRALAQPVPCRPCDYAECPVGYPCLHGVSVEQVVAAAQEVVAVVLAGLRAGMNPAPSSPCDVPLG
jgi:ADP-heptose:LPS heptosyltransferase